MINCIIKQIMYLMVVGMPAASLWVTRLSSLEDPTPGKLYPGTIRMAGWRICQVSRWAGAVMAAHNTQLEKTW